MITDTGLPMAAACSLTPIESAEVPPAAVACAPLKATKRAFSIAAAAGIARADERRGQLLVAHDERGLSRAAAEERERLARGDHLDEPLASRIFWRGVDTITFNFRNSTIIKASDGDRRVLKIVGEALPPPKQ